MYCLCFNMVSFRGQKNASATPRSVSFRDLIQNFRRASPPLSCAESPPGIIAVRTFLSLWISIGWTRFSEWLNILAQLVHNYFHRITYSSFPTIANNLIDRMTSYCRIYWQNINSLKVHINLKNT